MNSTVWPFSDLLPGHYAAILADPPLDFRAYTKLDENNWNGRRDAEKHYAVMTLDEIAALPVSQLAAPDAHLFLWTTGPHLPQALRVLEAWGFRYSGMGFVVLMRMLQDVTRSDFAQWHVKVVASIPCGTRKHEQHVDMYGTESSGQLEPGQALGDVLSRGRKAAPVARDRTSQRIHIHGIGSILQQTERYGK